MNFLFLIFTPYRPVWQHVSYTTTFALIASLFTVAVVDLLVSGGLAMPPDAQQPNLRLYIANALLVAPIIENALLTFFIEILRTFFDKISTIALTSGILFGAAHFFHAPALSISGSILFSVMSVTYMLFKNRSYLGRLAIITGQHALFNLVGLIASLAEHA